MSSDDGGYVHDPAAFPEDETESGAGDGPDGGPEPTEEAGGPHTARPDDEGTGRESFGRRGWTLVAILVVCFFVIPGVILLRPPGLPWEVALLVLPLLPGVLLGAAAVWSALGSDQS